MTAAKLEAAACAMRARNAATRQPHGRVPPPRKPRHAVVLPSAADIDAPMELLKAGLNRLAEVSMPYDVVMHEVARLYVRSAVKIHGSHTKAAKAISAHRNTLHRVERER